MTPITLPVNSAIVTDDCRWCGAVAGIDVHSAACPCDERYRFIQSIGGINGRPTAEAAR